MTTVIKKYKSISKKNEKKQFKTISLAKFKSNSIEVLVSKGSIELSISHDELVLINNVLKDFYDMKEEIKNSDNKLKFKLYI